MLPLDAWSISVEPTLLAGFKFALGCTPRYSTHGGVVLTFINGSETGKSCLWFTFIMFSWSISGSFVLHHLLLYFKIALCYFSLDSFYLWLTCGMNLLFLGCFDKWSDILLEIMISSLRVLQTLNRFIIDLPSWFYLHLSSQTGPCLDISIRWKDSLPWSNVRGDVIGCFYLLSG